MSIHYYRGTTGPKCDKKIKKARIIKIIRAKKGELSVFYG
jgi:hypothetical protein